METTRARLLIALVGLAACLGLSMGMTAGAQEKEKKPEPAKPAVGQAKNAKPDGPQYRLKNVVRLGYTRPGTPDDVTRKGEVVAIAFTDYKGKILGGTVYFMVLERVGSDQGMGDSWGTGMADFDSRFVPGRNFDGGVSPRLDSKAKYLYLYQLINDRGLDPHEGVAFAAYDAVRAQDVASFALRLLVDPRYITSWGHFQGTAFNAMAPDRNQINQVRLAADGSEVNIRLAVSSNPSILAELPQRKFMYRSPAYAIGKMGRTMDVGSDTTGLAQSSGHGYLSKNKAVISAAFVDNELQAAEGGKEPAFVQIMYFPDALASDLGFRVPDFPLNVDVPLDDRERARGMFRVDWRGANFVKLGQHSVVFGFTTDLPPVDEPIGIADTEAGMRGDGIRQVIADNNIVPAAAPGAAPGTAPTPVGGVAGIGGAALAGGFGGLGGLGGTIGAGGVGGLGFPAGAIGAARAPFFGSGGGFAGGTTGSTTPAQSQQGSQGGTTINFAATLINQQQQQQFQIQAQSQRQNQNNQCQNNVVPAPASVLLGLLGLPGLFLLRRRQQKAPMV
jgi:MYXO-CTERM domain-containing protein